MKDLKIKVVATRRWRSRQKKHEEIKKILNGGGFFNSIEIHTVHESMKPDVEGGRITEEWFEDKISRKAKAEGYNFALFAFSQSEGRRWGVNSGLRGTNYGDLDNFGEGWIKANERSLAKFADGSKRNQYVKTFCHEIGHELKRQGLTALEIHDYDYKDKINNNEQFYVDLGNTNTATVRALYALLRQLQAQLEALQKPTYHKLLNEMTVTYKYGVYDPFNYPITGHHIGTDYRASIGTPLFAPTDGAITRSGYSDALGFWCEVQQDDWYMVCMHLKEQPETRKVRRGEKIGEVGDTGRIYGVHLHVEIWKDSMDRGALTRENWRSLTVDPQGVFK